MTSILNTARAVRALKYKSPSRRTKNEQRRYRGALLASCVFAVGALLLSSVQTMAGCQSGDLADNVKTFSLSHRNCSATANTPGAAATSTAIGGFALAEGISSLSLGALSRAQGDYSVAIGSATSLPLANTAPQAEGTHSIAIGSGGEWDGARARGNFTVAIGTGANARGASSTAVGEFAGNGSSDPVRNAFNSAFGGEAGRFVTGAGNTGVGLAAGHTVVGDLNSALGNSAGQQVTGHRNLASGTLAGTTVNGSSNVALGDNAGSNINASYTVAVGPDARATAIHAVAIGRGASATRARAVAIGQGSVANVVDTVSVGNNNLKRRIVNVAPGVSSNDAVNVAQLQAALSAATAAVQRLEARIAQLEGDRIAAARAGN
jgi:hypothetical protein